MNPFVLLLIKQLWCIDYSFNSWLEYTRMAKPIEAVVATSKTANLVC